MYFFYIKVRLLKSNYLLSFVVLRQRDKKSGQIGQCRLVQPEEEFWKVGHLV